MINTHQKRPAFLSRLAPAALLLTLALSGTASAGMLSPGTPMPEFALQDQSGVVVRSADLIGKTWLLWFYPEAMTPGCTTEARGMRDQYAALKADGVVLKAYDNVDPSTHASQVLADAVGSKAAGGK